MLCSSFFLTARYRGARSPNFAFWEVKQRLKRTAFRKKWPAYYTRSKDRPSEESGIKLDNVKGEIEPHHVSFKYLTRYSIHYGNVKSNDIFQIVALVRGSGSGKYTVILPLQRFYDFDLDHITLERSEIQKFQLNWLRQQMGLVN